MANFIIRPLTALSYCVSMHNLRSALSDSYLQDKELQILGCFTTGFEPVGFAMYHSYDKNCALAYVEAQNASIEVVEALTQELIHRCKLMHIENIYWQSTYPRTPKDFMVERSDRLYRVDRELLPLWQNFKTAIRPVLLRLERKDFFTVPLSSCTQEHIEEIKTIYRSIHDNSYMESVLAGKLGKLLTDVSKVTLYKGKVAAFCIYAETEGHSCMLRYRCSAPAFRNSGAMLLPVIQAIDAYVVSDYQAMRFTIKTDNIDSVHLMQRHFASIKPKVIINNYKCVVNNAATLTKQRED